MTVFNSVTCPICGCLCDDIEVTVENNEVIKIKNGCAVCEAKFIGYNGEHSIHNAAYAKGRQTRPSIHGRSSPCSSRSFSQRQLPDSLRLELHKQRSPTSRRRINRRSWRRYGQHRSRLPRPIYLRGPRSRNPNRTLGQIRHRADLVIYWGCDPWSAHPRHLERYTSFTEGRFEKSEWTSYMQKLKAGAGKKKIESALRRLVSRKLQPQSPKHAI